MVTAALLASLALPAAGGEEAAEAAIGRMIESQSAVLDMLEGIDDGQALEQRRPTLLAALTRARRDTDAVAAHAETFAESAALREAFASQLRQYAARRETVYAGVMQRLDEDALDRLDAIFDEAE
jgi:hypothetical protein